MRREKERKKETKKEKERKKERKEKKKTVDEEEFTTENETQDTMGEKNGVFCCFLFYIVCLFVCCSRKQDERKMEVSA